MCVFVGYPLIDLLFIDVSLFPSLNYEHDNRKWERKCFHQIEREFYNLNPMHSLVSPMTLAVARRRDKQSPGTVLVRQDAVARLNQCSHGEKHPRDCSCRWGSDWTTT